jgi:hypothetical protein
MNNALNSESRIKRVGLMFIIGIIVFLAFSGSAYMVYKNQDTFHQTFDPVLAVLHDYLNFISGKQSSQANTQQQVVDTTSGAAAKTKHPQSEQATVLEPDEPKTKAEISLPNDVVRTESNLADEKITFSTIYLSLRKSCVEREIDLMQFTHYLTEEYLRVYGYDIGRANMQCIFLYDFINSNFDKERLMDGKNFVILATNALQAMQFVEQKYFNAAHNEPVSVRGHVKVGTTPYLVLVQAYRSDETAWTLSHELAHMILYMKNNQFWIDGVHKYQEVWNRCQDPAPCREVWLKIEHPYAPYAQEYYMMDVRSFL